MTSTHAFAILAPVPEMHLASGLEAVSIQLDADLKPKIAFGSNAFEVFREVDKLRDGKLVDVFIYASHSQEDQSLDRMVTWKATYIGHVESRRGHYPGNKKYRPESTKTDSPQWAIFWEVEGLEKLRTSIPIGTLMGLNSTRLYAPQFAPEGPVLIEHPMP
ncbi:hypothetical protein [Synechococcus sp. PCC 6312]|uniref:hypothetical protein n=1 Tax=Synechococcus sp. (strain ATCC 27167 / PCC 6312) TaxID=195253 RepID=UPI0003046E61|nr:hypothetical protein [Synechococcus sp. PCC 6312]